MQYTVNSYWLRDTWYSTQNLGTAYEFSKRDALCRLWKIRKRCQGSGSRAKYLAAKKSLPCTIKNEDRLEIDGAGKELSTKNEMQSFGRVMKSGFLEW